MIIVIEQGIVVSHKPPHHTVWLNDWRWMDTKLDSVPNRHNRDSKTLILQCRCGTVDGYTLDCKP